MITTIFICCLIAIFFSACALIADKLTKPAPEPKREPLPFTSRHLKPNEIATLIHQLYIIDSIHPITPENYHDETRLTLEELISARLGVKFQLTSRDWFHIMRAWYVTRGQDSAERIERLDLRLKLNI